VSTRGTGWLAAVLGCLVSSAHAGGRREWAGTNWADQLKGQDVRFLRVGRKKRVRESFKENPFSFYSTSKQIQIQSSSMPCINLFLWRLIFDFIFIRFIIFTMLNAQKNT
jgi:hypothetical protein